MSDQIKLSTTPRDVRFPNTNQAQHCWTRYNEWVLCLKRTGGDEDGCDQLRKYARSLCNETTFEEWNEQRENGNFLGVQIEE